MLDYQYFHIFIINNFHVNVDNILTTIDNRKNMLFLLSIMCIRLSRMYCDYQYSIVKNVIHYQYSATIIENVRMSIDNVVLNHGCSNSRSVCDSVNCTCDHNESSCIS